MQIFLFFCPRWTNETFLNSKKVKKENGKQKVFKIQNFEKSVKTRTDCPGGPDGRPAGSGAVSPTRVHPPITLRMTPVFARNNKDPGEEECNPRMLSPLASPGDGYPVLNSAVVGAPGRGLAGLRRLRLGSAAAASEEGEDEDLLTAAASSSELEDPFSPSPSSSTDPPPSPFSFDFGAISLPTQPPPPPPRHLRRPAAAVAPQPQHQVRLAQHPAHAQDELRRWILSASWHLDYGELEEEMQGFQVDTGTSLGKTKAATRLYLFLSRVTNDLFFPHLLCLLILRRVSVCTLHCVLL